MRRVIMPMAIVILIVSELFLLKANYSLRAELILKNRENLNLINTNATLKPQYATGIKNNGKILSSNIELKDVSGNAICIKEQIRSMGGKSLICRISDSYCDDCVEYAIGKIVDLKKKYNADNIMILSANESQKTFKMYVDKFGLQDAKIFRCQSLGIPAENIMAPYCIAVDNTLEVLGIYVPDKVSRYMDIDPVNIDMLYNLCTETRIVQ